MAKRLDTHPLPSQGKKERAAAVMVVSSEFENVLMVAPALKKDVSEQKSWYIVYQLDADALCLFEAYRHCCVRISLEKFRSENDRVIVIQRCYYSLQDLRCRYLQ